LYLTGAENSSSSWFEERKAEAMATIQLTQPVDLKPRTHASDTHRVQFYEDESFLSRSVAQHLAGSLRDGGSAILLATSDHRRQIFEELTKLEISVDALAKRIVTVDAGEALSQFMVDGAPEPARFNSVVHELVRAAKSSTRSPLSPISAFGEMVAVLWSEGKHEAAVRLEQLWNDFIKSHTLMLLCAYPIAHFSRSEDQRLFSEICAQHSSVLPTESFASLVAEDPTAREIAELQQRAESLAREVQARKMAEAKLRAVQAELESLVEQRTTALRKLSLQVLKLQDLERRRIARELHDSLGQQFVGLRVNLNLARRSPADPEHFKQCDLLLERCIDEVRTLSYLLHPPMIEDAGFVSAAQWYIEDFSRRSSMNISFSTSGEVGRLPEYLKLVLFRVLQEALMNLYRHARATTGKVRVGRSADVVSLEIQDNGVGIAIDKLARFNRNGTGMGVGLTGMRERVRDLGGRFALSSSSAGTLLRISVPVSRKSQ
jgi:signal transduction histidine kinase